MPDSSSIHHAGHCGATVLHGGQGTLAGLGTHLPALSTGGGPQEAAARKLGLRRGLPAH